MIKPRFQELIGKMRKKFKTPILDANQSISSIGVNGVSSEIEDAEKLHGLWNNELRTVQNNCLHLQIWPIDLDGMYVGIFTKVFMSKTWLIIYMYGASLKQSVSYYRQTKYD